MRIEDCKTVAELQTLLGCDFAFARKAFSLLLQARLMGQPIDWDVLNYRPSP